MKIYPYLIDSKKMSDFYETLLNDKFKVKVFNKKTNKELYNYFLPVVREYMFWTFNIDDKKDFNSVSNELMSAICFKYQTNIFEKDETQIIAFDSGICFLVTADKKEIENLSQYKYKKDMNTINLRENEEYSLPSKKNKLQPKDYAYILQLYKMINLNLLQKEIQKPEKFDVVRNRFVKFTQEIFNLKITDDAKENEQCENWNEELNLTKKYIELENQFDLLYKNNKLNESKNTLNIAIVLAVVVVIIGLINLAITSM